jgi:hypothetical protein
MSFIITLRGGGDLASGVAMRLHYGPGCVLPSAELPQPLAVRRMVSFAEAVYEGEIVVEGITARRITDPSDTLRVLRIFAQKQIRSWLTPISRLCNFCAQRWSSMGG